MVKITITDDSVILTAPYDPALPSKAKALGGRYKDRTWAFALKDEQRVRELAREIYGTDGSETSHAVTVRVDTRKLNFRDHYGEIRLAGRSLARRTGRDVAVRLGDGVVVVNGRFPATGGSVKNPCLDFVGLDIVLEVRNVPFSVAQKMIAEAGADAVNIIDADQVDREALSAERARLIARVAEINALLGD